MHIYTPHGLIDGFNGMSTHLGHVMPKRTMSKDTPWNNPAKFQNYLMNGLGGVADEGPLYMYIKEMVLGGISPKIPPPNEKIPNINS